VKGSKPLNPSSQATMESVDDTIPSKITAIDIDSEISTIVPVEEMEDGSANGSVTTLSTEPTKVKNWRARKPKKYILKEDYIDIIKDAFWESRPWILG
jgi:hypothetical protein